MLSMVFWFDYISFPSFPFLSKSGTTSSPRPKKHNGVNYVAHSGQDVQDWLLNAIYILNFVPSKLKLYGETASQWWSLPGNQI